MSFYFKPKIVYNVNDKNAQHNFRVSTKGRHFILRVTGLNNKLG